MLADRPLPDDLAARLEGLVRDWRRDPDLAAVWLFGSRALGKAHARSDVDLAVALRSGLDPDARFHKRLDLMDDAARHLGTDAIDLVVLDDAPPLLAHRALRDGRLILETDPQRRTAVVEQSLRRFIDTAPIRRELDRALAIRVRVGTFAG